MGAPAGEIARQLTLEYPGGSLPLAIQVNGEGSSGTAGVVVLDSVHGQLGTIAAENAAGGERFHYADVEATTLVLQLYNWGQTPVDVAITPSDLSIRSDEINSACAQ